MGVGVAQSLVTAVQLFDPQSIENARPRMRLKWPGDDRTWIWKDEEWVALNGRFYGGDMWIEQDP